MRNPRLPGEANSEPCNDGIGRSCRSVKSKDELELGMANALFAHGRDVRPRRQALVGAGDQRADTAVPEKRRNGAVGRDTDVDLLPKHRKYRLRGTRNGTLTICKP